MTKRVVEVELVKQRGNLWASHRLDIVGGRTWSDEKDQEYRACGKLNGILNARH